MPRFSTLPLLLFLPLPISVSAQAAPPAGGAIQHFDTAAVRAEIDAGNAAYIAAFRRADAKALSRVYDPEGSRLKQGGVVVRGRSAIADDVAKFVSEVGPVRVTLSTKDLWLIDDKAYETGVWSYAFHPKGKPEQKIGGHYVTVWRRQPDGGWKIWADIGVPGT
jgi:uncharacterized protein (TIGR02246 family)